MKEERKTPPYTMSFGVILLLLVAIYFAFPSKAKEEETMSGDNKEGKLYLELTPDYMKVDQYRSFECYRATIMNANGEELISETVLHVVFNNEKYEGDYGRWEISKYEFKKELVKEEEVGWISSSTYEVERLVLYVDIVEELPLEIGIKVSNIIEELQLGEEHQFIFDYYPKRNYKIEFSETSLRDDEEPVLEVNNSGLIKAINYGDTILRISVRRDHYDIMEKTIQISVPYKADSIRLVPNDNTNEIELDEFRKCLNIVYTPNYATNTEYVVETDRSILEFDETRSDTKNICFIPKSRGTVTVTVITDNDVRASIDFIVK